MQPSNSKGKSQTLESKLVLLNDLFERKFIYRGLRYIPSKGLAGESYKYLLNSEKHISVELTLYPEFGNQSDCILVYLKNDRTGKYFSLYSWFQQSNAVGNKGLFDLSLYQGDFEQKLNQFLVFINGLFKNTELAAALEGRAWPDVGFDWGDVK